MDFKVNGIEMSRIFIWADKLGGATNGFVIIKEVYTETLMSGWKKT